MAFSVERFWEERLRERSDLSGVGYSALGLPFNEWMYRVRAHVFTKVMHTLSLGPRVLDVGSGTGFYVELWKSFGHDVTGIDISPSVVKRLAAAYPDTRFLCGDISTSNADLTASYDVISAFDVLFHILDDNDYKRAIHAIASHLTQGGIFLYADNLPDERVTYRHQVSRSRNEIESLLLQNGLTIVKEIPMFVLMNQPIASNNRLLRAYWKNLARLLAKLPWLGNVLGAFLYPFELILISVATKGPSTKLLVCEKI